MPVLIATDAGTKLAVSVDGDSAADRIVSMNRHLGEPQSWLPSYGAVVAIRDGAEVLEVDVKVQGPVTTAVGLWDPGGQVLALSRVITVAIGESALVRFRFGRNPDRDAALAAPPP